MIARLFLLLALALVPSSMAYTISLGIDQLGTSPMTEDTKPDGQLEVVRLINMAIDECGLAQPVDPKVQAELPPAQRMLTAEEFEEEMASVTGRDLGTIDCWDPNSPCQRRNPPSWCVTFCGPACKYCRLRRLKQSPSASDEACICAKVRKNFNTVPAKGQLLYKSKVSYCAVLDPYEF